MADGDIRVDKPRARGSAGSTPGDPEGAATNERTGDAATEPAITDSPAPDGSQDDSPDYAPTFGALSTAVAGPRSLEDLPPAARPARGARIRRGDRAFALLTAAAAVVIVLIVLLIAAFLLIKAVPSIADDKVNFLTSTEWNVSSADLRFGIAALLYTTVMSSLLALLLAVPLAIGIALFITQYAPARLARPVAHAVDLLAAIPSIIYGVWGIRVLAPYLHPVQRALGSIGLGIFDDKGVDRGTVFVAGIVLAIMILPIVTAISRDVFERTPTANKEAALALGATRWEMVRMAVLPYGRAGVVSGAMLGLGRALGETVAVLLILSKVSQFSPSLLSGGETFATKIAGSSAEFGSNPGPYIAAGLVLFVLTFVVNAAARAIVNRRKDFV
jgi:phosphate transport system permease protein